MDFQTYAQHLLQLSQSLDKDAQKRSGGVTESLEEASQILMAESRNTELDTRLDRTIRELATPKESSQEAVATSWTPDPAVGVDVPLTPQQARDAAPAAAQARPESPRIDVSPVEDTYVSKPVIWENPFPDFQANQRVVSSTIMVPAADKGMFLEAFEEAERMMRLQPKVVEIVAPEIPAAELPAMPEYLPKLDFGEGAAPARYGSPPMRDMAWSFERVEKRLGQISRDMERWQRTGRIES